jgi:hypothetical protein
LPYDSVIIVSRILGGRRHEISPGGLITDKVAGFASIPEKQDARFSRPAQLVESGALNPSTYHTTNLLLHRVNVMLVGLIVFALVERTWPAAIVAALFAVHPANVAAVAPISVRGSLLYAAFYRAAYFAYLGYLKRSPRSLTASACLPDRRRLPTPCRSVRSTSLIFREQERSIRRAGRRRVCKSHILQHRLGVKSHL